jgi:ribosomal subunit interface protein
MRDKDRVSVHSGAHMTDENITVGSAHVELGERFSQQAQDEIRKLAKKYLGNLTMASVHVAREGARYRCSVNMQMGGYNQMVAEAKGTDVPMAFRTALGKVSKQLRRAKRLLREDRQNRPARMATA